MVLVPERIDPRSCMILINIGENRTCDFKKEHATLLGFKATPPDHPKWVATMAGQKTGKPAQTALPAWPEPRWSG